MEEKTAVSCGRKENCVLLKGRTKCFVGKNENRALWKRGWQCFVEEKKGLRFVEEKSNCALWKRGTFAFSGRALTHSIIYTQHKLQRKAHMRAVNVNEVF